MDPPPPFCPEEDPTETSIRRDKCISDPGAQVPQWTVQMQPFLNSRVCEYYIPIQTAYDCPGAGELPSRVEEFVSEAIQGLLNFLEKSADSTQLQILRNFVLNEGFYDFDKTPNLTLKLLYRWPFALVKALNLSDRISESAPTATTSAEFSTSELISNLDILGLTLDVLAPQQISLWVEDKAKIVVGGTTREVGLAQEAQQVPVLRTSLIDFLREKNYGII